MGVRQGTYLEPVDKEGWKDVRKPLVENLVDPHCYSGQHY